MNKRVFLVGGGTGGHLFPALALGQELKNRDYSVCLITDSRCAKYLPCNLALDTHILSLGSLKSNFCSKIFMAIKMFFAMAKSIALLIKYRPSLVIGFGGYTAFPSVFAAKLCNIPIMLHEQNCFLGKVNRFFASYAKKIALNFPDTRSVPSGIEDKIVVTGNPVRQEILQNVTDYKDPTKGSLNILVIGGSQSAKIFSTIVPEAISIIKEKAPKLKVSIVQQASKENSARILSHHELVSGSFLDEKKERSQNKFGMTNNIFNGFDDNMISIYSKFCKKFEIEEFFSDMPKRYNDSDIVICRSGASTVAELIALAKPAIMIPFPLAADNHQFYNAKFLEDRNAGWCFEQKNITAEIMADKIIEVANNNKLLQNISENLCRLRLNAACILADTVEEIMRP